MKKAIDGEKKLAEEMELSRKRQIVSDVCRDFSARQQERKQLERGWQLNMNFVSGNQFCDIAASGEIEEKDSEFYWQSRCCYNHIAPTVDTRLARLAKVRPSLRVKAFSDSEDDIKTARLCSNILLSAKNRVDLDSVITRATVWSETCGTAFYKIVWNYEEGNVIGVDDAGHSVKEGDVNVVAISPFEIYPDTLTAESLDDVKSLIHAKAVPVEEIQEKFGVEMAGRTVSDFALLPYAAASGWKRPYQGEARPMRSGMEILIERYTRPCAEAPEGKLEIVAGGELLYEGPLPYLNGDRGARVFPFVRQTCNALAGCFFGMSVVDRMIPLQRAYNAVRNRKQEFLNRLSMGVIAVEDGSLDADDLAADGLYPGKVLVYRQGAPMPEFLDFGTFPEQFAEEEERISNEFMLVSGMSEVSRNSSTPSNIVSATGLQLLLDQDTNRMQMSVESVERAVKEIGKQILHLYKQFASAKRLLRMTGPRGEAELSYFSASDISADDVQFETGYDRSGEKTREEIITLFSLGLLNNEEGKLTQDTRNKVLEALGYGSFENDKDVSRLHLQKAERENALMEEQEVSADEYDDHALHVVEHTRALLSGGERDEAYKRRVTQHLAQHKAMQEKI